MALNENIILSGQNPDIVGQLMRGTAAAGAQNQLMDTNRLRGIYQTQGAGIANGDPGALNVLAGVDPMAAQGVRQNMLAMDATRLGMDATRQDMQMQTERMQMARDEAKRAAADQIAGMDAATAKAHADALKSAVSGAAMATTPEQWDEAARRAGAPEYVGQFANRYQIIAQVLGTADALDIQAAQTPVAPDPLKGAPSGYAWNEPGNPQAGVSVLPGYAQEPKDDYGRYVQEETKAGRQPLSRIDYSQAIKGAGIVQTMAPDGTVTTQIGGKPADQGDKINYSPLEVASVVDTIDKIANDPALSKVVGPLEGGGGNNIDELSATQRMYYGGDGTALVERIGQLQNTTWLAARAMLKGGGAITDYESKKAEGAMSRLSRAKSKEEFRNALFDLRDAINEGQAKLDAARGGATTSATGGATFTFNPATGELE